MYIYKRERLTFYFAENNQIYIEYNNYFYTVEHLNLSSTRQYKRDLKKIILKGEIQTITDLYSEMNMKFVLKKISKSSLEPFLSLDHQKM